MTAMREVIKEFIPHAPQIGLFVEPNIPPDKLRNAVRDYANDVDEREVIALFDATLMGSAKDGAVFTSDRLVFQNNDLEAAQVVRYEDIVDVQTRRKLLGGRRVILSINRGRATFELQMDFSGKPDATEYVTRFLKEAMLRSEMTRPTMDASSGREAGEGSRQGGEEHVGDDPPTDVRAVRAALEALHADGLLSRRDLEKMRNMLGSG